MGILHQSQKNLTKCWIEVKIAFIQAQRGLLVFKYYIHMYNNNSLTVLVAQGD